MILLIDVQERKRFLLAFPSTRRLIKSTFFLVSLFGLHYILFVFLPVEVNSSVFKIWTFAELALSSTQVGKEKCAREKWMDSTRLTCLYMFLGLCGGRALLLPEWRGKKKTQNILTFGQIQSWLFESVNYVTVICFQVQHELQRHWRRWRLTRHLPSRRRQHHGSVSHCSSPHTQVLLLPCAPAGQTTCRLPLDTVEM